MLLYCENRVFLEVPPIQLIEFEKKILFPGESIHFKFRGENYSIRAYGVVNKKYSMGPYSLEIENGKGISQIFAYTKRFNDAMFSLRWAGDLDGDGKLDLLIDGSDHYAGSKIVLFLSSYSDGGELFKKVAEFSRANG
jgi:hypothetical protein